MGRGERCRTALRIDRARESLLIDWLRASATLLLLREIDSRLRHALINNACLQQWKSAMKVEIKGFSSESIMMNTCGITNNTLLIGHLVQDK